MDHEAQLAQQIVSDWASVHVVPEVEKLMDVDYSPAQSLPGMFGDIRVGKSHRGIIHIRFTNALLADALIAAFADVYVLSELPKQGKYYVLYIVPTA